MNLQFKTMRALVFTDVHIKPDNLAQIDLLTLKVRKLIKQHSVDTVIILGDILHTHERVHTQCMLKACEMILILNRSIEGNVYIVVGNHDMIDSMQYLSDHHWMVPLKYWQGVVVCDTVVSEDDVVFCPYVAKGRFVEALNTSTDWKKAKIIFAHQEIRGCVYNNKTSTSSDVWLEEYPQLISGHIHKHQQFKNILYLGAVQQTQYGEFENGENNYVLVVDTTPETPAIEKIVIDMPKKATVTVNLNDTVNSVDSDAKWTSGTRLVVEADSIEECKGFKKTTKYKELMQNGVNVVFKQKLKATQQFKTQKFMEVLAQLVQKENNPHLNELFTEIIK
jgi:DNA repair exonuclease SbcCD nuclease subunit